MNTRRMGRFGGGAGHVAMLPTGHVAYWPCCHVPRGHVAYWPCCQRSCLLARGGSDHMRFVLFFFLSSMPATAMHSSEQCTARVPTLLCPTGLTSQRTMPASTFLENTPSPRQTRTRFNVFPQTVLAHRVSFLDSKELGRAAGLAAMLSPSPPRRRRHRPVAASSPPMALLCVSLLCIALICDAILCYDTLRYDVL